MQENRIKHLEFIQGVINRLFTNSFLLKGWSVLLVSGLFALSAKDSNVSFVFLAYIPAIVFWGLDGYFLLLERSFRDLYDSVRQMNSSDIDFSMKLNPNTTGIGAWCNSTFSKTLIPFHGSIVTAIIIVMLIQL